MVTDSPATPWQPHIFIYERIHWYQTVLCNTCIKYGTTAHSAATRTLLHLDCVSLIHPVVSRHIYFTASHIVFMGNSTIINMKSKGWSPIYIFYQPERLGTTLIYLPPPSLPKKNSILFPLLATARFLFSSFQCLRRLPRIWKQF
jgi:hypothetical protein